jgi:hypothetical protein
MPQGTVQSVMATLPSGLVALLGRLTTVRYEWQLDHDGYDVIEWLKTIPVPLSEATALTSRDTETGRHAVLLDIDYPAYVVPSLTGDSNHVYLDVPDGLSERRYRRLLKAFYRAGVFKKDGHLVGSTSLALPWVLEKRDKSLPVPRQQTVDLPEGLSGLLSRLTTVRYEWNRDHVPFDRDGNRDSTVCAPMHEATAVMSANAETGRHAVLLDIDYPAYVVPSSTGGHNHIYLDVPDGLSDRQHRRLMKALGKAGVVEKEWAHANRHGSALRPPWVTKDAS